MHSTNKKRKSAAKSKPKPEPEVKHNPVLFDYAKASGLSLDPDIAEALNQIMADDPREVIYQLERDATREASKQFDQLRDQIQAQEQERVRLWGKKYPPAAGMTPDDLNSKKSIKLQPIPYRSKAG